MGITGVGATAGAIVSVVGVRIGCMITSILVMALQGGVDKNKLAARQSQALASV